MPREVILFNNAGISNSSGAVPRTAACELCLHSPPSNELDITLAFVYRRDGRSAQLVVVVLTLGDHRDKALFLESREVHACRRRAHLGHNRKFRAGARVSIRQAKQNASPGRLTDGRPKRGDGSLDGLFHIHSSTVTEVLLEEVIQKLPENTTKVIIAHRLNTIHDADEIFFVNGGAVTAAGSFEHAVDLLMNAKRNS